MWRRAERAPRSRRIDARVRSWFPPSIVKSLPEEEDGLAKGDQAGLSHGIIVRVGPDPEPQQAGIDFHCQRTVASTDAD